jgi:hypothetical protein
VRDAHDQPCGPVCASIRVLDSVIAASITAISAACRYGCGFLPGLIRC